MASKGRTPVAVKTAKARKMSIIENVMANNRKSAADIATGRFVRTPDSFSSVDHRWKWRMFNERPSVSEAMALEQLDKLGLLTWEQKYALDKFNRRY